MRMRPPGTPSASWVHPAPEVCDGLGVDVAAGLDEAEAARRFGLDGPNRLRSEPSPSRLALGAGDRVAADGRVVDATLLQLDESALTGESLPRSKRADPPDPPDAPPAERHTSVLAGTTVTRGVGRFVVTATSADTEMGRIAGAAARHRARTPLQARLDHLAKLLIPIAAGICATLALLAYLPALHGVFGTASLGLDAVLFAVPFPFIVWGADEIRRWLRRRRETVARARQGTGEAFADRG
jgi:hypothetical protein